MRTKAEAVDALRADQQFWRALAVEVGPARYAAPGPMGSWSFGDLAGHLLGWRERTIARLEAGAAGRPQPDNPWPSTLDGGDDDDAAINDWIHAQHAGRRPEQLVVEYDASYDRLIAALDSLPEEAVTDPNAVPWLGMAVADVDFTGHLHDEHVPAVRAWLDAS
jgi:mycothiol maleylpyruvate isomerase-like protein